MGVEVGRKRSILLKNGQLNGDNTVNVYVLTFSYYPLSGTAGTVQQLDLGDTCSSGDEDSPKKGGKKVARDNTVTCNGGSVKKGREKGKETKGKATVGDGGDGGGGAGVAKTTANASTV